MSKSIIPKEDLVEAGCYRPYILNIKCVLIVSLFALKILELGKEIVRVPQMRKRHPDKLLN